VITPQSHSMEEAVAIMTGAVTLSGAAAGEAASRPAGDGQDQ
jgi:hypothetical protein